MIKLNVINNIKNVSKFVLGGTMSLLSMIKHFCLVAAPVTATQVLLILGSFVAVTLTGQYSTVDLAGMAMGSSLFWSHWYSSWSHSYRISRLRR